MNTEKQAQQLELAAAILRTGHPCEQLHGAESIPCEDVLRALNLHREIRIVLATPPYPAELHNHDNLTAEQVGVGWRLLLGEQEWRDYISYGSVQAWSLGRWYEFIPKPEFKDRVTYRTPLQNPWPEAPKPDPYAHLKEAHAAGKVIEVNIGKWVNPEAEDQWESRLKPAWDIDAKFYRIKPEPPPFQLPPPPPGMQWHRTDGWKEGDLPPGWRPLTLGEDQQSGDSAKYDGKWDDSPIDLGRPMRSSDCHRRTTGPLTFTHEGKQWTYHRPGDPMPCEKQKLVTVLYNAPVEEFHGNPCPAFCFSWLNQSGYTTIIGWRYADPETIPLGPEDCPPGSVFRHKDWLPGIYRAYLEVNTTGVNWNVNSALDWMDLKDSYWQINRSIPLTGKWDADAWEPCHKPAS